MSLRKKMIPAASPYLGTRSLSVASVGRWLDDDSLYEDCDIRSSFEESSVEGSASFPPQKGDFFDFSSSNSTCGGSPEDAYLKAQLVKQQKSLGPGGESFSYKILGISPLQSKMLGTQDGQQSFTYDLVQKRPLPPLDRKHYYKECRRRSGSLESNISRIPKSRQRSCSSSYEKQVMPRRDGLVLGGCFLSIPSRAEGFPDMLCCTHKNVEEFDLYCLLEKVRKGIKAGYKPTIVEDGLSGAYFLRDERGALAAVFKPRDEEPFHDRSSSQRLRKGISAGEGAIREVMAYAIDRDAFAGVPATALVQLSSAVFTNEHMFKNSGTCTSRSYEFPLRSHSSPDMLYERMNKEYNLKEGSLQVYIPHNSTAEDVGTCRLSLESVHRIGVFDIRVLNTDRHCGNLLLNYLDENAEKIRLIPIDHGLCFPDWRNIDDDIAFAWMSWPQAREPFNQMVCDYIEGIKVDEDLAHLRLLLGPRFRIEFAVTIHIGAILLKNSRDAHLTLYEIGKIICGKSVTMALDTCEMIPESPLNTILKKVSTQTSPIEHDEVSANFLEALEKEIEDYIFRMKGYR